MFGFWIATNLRYAFPAAMATDKIVNYFNGFYIEHWLIYTKKQPEFDLRKFIESMSYRHCGRDCRNPEAKDGISLHPCDWIPASMLE